MLRNLDGQIKSLKARLAKSVDREELVLEQKESCRAREQLRALRQQLNDAGFS